MLNDGYGIMDDHEDLSPGRLVVLELGGAFVVVNEDDPNDWIASFTPGDAFPARDWAERMAALYNLRNDDSFADEYEHAPAFSGTHDPLVES
jgi:hypothetical protein